MPIVGRDGIQIDRIRRAGLGRVRAAALRDGLDPERVTRDFAILRAVANGGISTAAAKCRISRETVLHALRRYEKYAQQILDNDNRAAPTGGAAAARR